MRDRVIIIAVFLLARAVCWQLGVSFDADNLGTWWQIADPELLRTQLLTTLYYLHSQPPLFNLLVGAGLKAGMAAFPLIMASVYGAVSLGGILCLYALARAVLDVRWLSLALALWFCVSPDVLLFNEKLFYDGLVPGLLCAGFWGIHAGLQRDRGVVLVFGFGMLAAVVLLRSMFHPLWLVAVIGLVFVLSGYRARVLACAALPAAAVGAVLLKNLLVFGFFGLSSWAPLNLVGVTVEKLPAEERQALVEQGRLSPLSSIDSFGPMERLLPLLPPIPRTGKPVLDALEKSNGRPNMNHAAMLAASRLRTPDALAALRADPLNYALIVAMSLYHFHRPANEFRDVRRNLALMDGWARVANATAGLQPAAWFGSSLNGGRPAALLLQISYGAVLISYGFAGAGRRVAGQAWLAAWKQTPASPELLTMALVVWTGAFVVLVSSALDVLENNRARYTVAPLLTLAAFWFIVQQVRAARPAPTVLPSRSLEPAL